MDHEYEWSAAHKTEEQAQREPLYSEDRSTGRQSPSHRQFSFAYDPPVHEGSYNSSPYQVYSPPEAPPTTDKDGHLRPESGYNAPELVHDTGLYHNPQRGHGHHRSLSPAFSQGSTTYESNIGSPPMSHDDGKEVYRTYEQPVHIPQSHERKKRKVCGLPCAIFLLILAILILVAVGLGAGLGVGLGSKKSAQKSDGPPSGNGTTPISTYVGDPDLAIGGVLNPTYYSTKGAFNGSGIAFEGGSADDPTREYTVYFQHWTGSIRWQELTKEGSYKGGSMHEVVATDAKNNTPLSVVAYSINSTAKTHLFYIGQDGYIKQKSDINHTHNWQDGPVNSLKLKALDAESVGLQACWYGNFYGDNDASKFPTSNGEVNQDSFSLNHGMHLWYASDNTTFEQYGIYDGADQWIFEKSWAGFNGHAGVGCYSWGPGTVSYAMLVNLHNSVELWWKDINSNYTSTETHPIQSWNNASDAAIPNAFPATSLGYTTFFFVQLENKEIHGYNISFNSENSTVENSITVGDADGPIEALGGTHLTNSAVGDASGGSSLFVFAQQLGNDISVFIRDLSAGQWSSGTLPIPEE